MSRRPTKPLANSFNTTFVTEHLIRRLLVTLVCPEHPRHICGCPGAQPKHQRSTFLLTPRCDGSPSIVVRKVSIRRAAFRILEVTDLCLCRIWLSFLFLINECSFSLFNAGLPFRRTPSLRNVTKNFSS